jgi:hypothetical protein
MFLLLKCCQLNPKPCLSRANKIHWQARLEPWGTRLQSLHCSKNLKELLGNGIRAEKKRMWDGLLTKMWFRGFLVKTQSSTNFNFGMPTEEKNSTGTEALN